MPVCDLPAKCSFFSTKKEVLIVFLPSAITNQKTVRPYFPRISWVEFLKGSFDCLYLADPFDDIQSYQAFGGSWFIDNTTKTSVIEQMAVAIREFSAAERYKKTILYGSSMGGYAALLLGGLLDNCTVFAECPQIYLEKYSKSKELIDFLGISPDHLPNVLDFMTKKQTKYHLYINLHDNHHMQEHMLPLINDLQKLETTLDLKINIYADVSYAKGHTALRIQDMLPSLLGCIDACPPRT